MNSKKPRFALGECLATPGAIEAMNASAQSATDFLKRHAKGDWGDLSEEDRELNELALQDGSRLLSAYKTLKGVKLWVITEAVGDDGHRAATTILLPEEY